MSNSWTREKVKERIGIAGKVEWMVDAPRGPNGYKSCMPAPMKEWGNYGQEEARGSRPQANPEQITIWEQVLVIRPWKTWTTTEEWAVIWEWAHYRRRWKDIAYNLNLDKREVLRRFSAGIDRIVSGLNK